MYWYDYVLFLVYALLALAFACLALAVWEVVLIVRGGGSSPAEGMERSIRDEYSLPIPMEVIRFGPSTSREEGLRHIEGMRRRLATDAEVQAFLAHNPEVRIDWARDFIVVPPA